MSLATSTTAQHPCFDAGARGTAARIHLPVAPRCNIQCNYCNRKYDCVNESRPGVTSAVLTPEQAVLYLELVMARENRITVAGIAGPGDPFATPEETLQTLRLVRQRFPRLLLCVATNGLNVPAYLDPIADIGISHFTITANAIDPDIAARVYAWARPGRFALRGREAAVTLIERQLQSIRGLKERGVTVKVNTIVIPGVNDHHIPAVAQCVAELGADMHNCIPLYPTADTPFADLPQPTAAQVSQIRAEAGRFLPQMTHCQRCRADAVGLLGHDRSGEFSGCLSACSTVDTTAASADDRSRPFVAVASWEGMLVNQHLGEATDLWIFAPDESGAAYRLIEMRKTPPAGGGNQRWLDLAAILHDCRCVLVGGIGQSPRDVLTQRGIRVIEMEGVIEEGLDGVYRARDMSHLKKRFQGCGSGCTGTGGGCG